jgi:hypothetical protein
MKEFYGVGILFFYFLKWPYVLGLPLLYNHGLAQNIILNVLYVYCLFLILKDFYMFYVKRKASKKEP